MRHYWLILLFSLGAWPVGASPDNPTVRVALTLAASSARVQGVGGLSLKTPSGTEVLARYPDQPLTVAGNGTVLVQGTDYGSSALLVPRGGAFYLNGRKYRGYLKAVAQDGGVTLVNYLPLETYIQSVLGGEISGSWPTATLQAHAIASRTYAAYMLTTPRGEYYDLAATVLDQVYPGATAESGPIQRAVEATRSQVLARPEVGLLKTFYSSNCGGHTSDSEPVFFKEKVPPLLGVPDPYCAGAPNSHWTADFNTGKIQQRFTAMGYPVGPIVELGPLSYDASGRIETFRVLDDKGVERLVPGAELRRVLGYRALKGTRTQMEAIEKSGERPVRVRFRGQGWGHGVGLCQWGALEMGRRGMAHRQILGHYYPEAEIQTLPLDE